jgi:LacI family transcriptional regulator
VDGLITQTYQLSRDDIHRLIEAGIAVVIHGDEPTHPFADNIKIREAEAVEEIVSYLIEKGHRRIGTIAGSQDKWTGRVRLAGYVNALQAYTLPIEQELIYEMEYTRGNGALAMQHLMALDEPPTAVFAANDLLAVDALLYAVDAGLSIPQDVAIAGFDDILEASIVRPRLTTIHKDVQLLGRVAAQMLIERINSEELLPARQRVIEYELIRRESA